jgi:hypothetical protein
LGREVIRRRNKVYIAASECFIIQTQSEKQKGLHSWPDVFAPHEARGLTSHNGTTHAVVSCRSVAAFRALAACVLQLRIVSFG